MSLLLRDTRDEIRSQRNCGEIASPLVNRPPAVELSGSSSCLPVWVICPRSCSSNLDSANSREVRLPGNIYLIFCSSLVGNRPVEVPLLVRIISQISGINWMDSSLQQATQSHSLLSLASQPSRTFSFKSSTISTWSELIELTKASIKTLFDIFHSLAIKLMASKAQLIFKFLGGKHLNDSFLLSHCTAIIDLLDTLLERSFSLLTCLPILSSIRCKTSLSDSPDLGPPLTGSLLARDQLPSQLSNLCDMMLQFDWRMETDAGDLPLTKQNFSSKDVGLMTKLHLKWSTEPLLRVKFFVQDIFSELKDLRYNEPCTTYPTISIGMCPSSPSHCSSSWVFVFVYLSQLCSHHESVIANINFSLERHYDSIFSLT
jgi:hypothetical protein